MFRFSTSVFLLLANLDEAQAARKIVRNGLFKQSADAAAGNRTSAESSLTCKTAQSPPAHWGYVPHDCLNCDDGQCSDDFDHDVGHHQECSFECENEVSGRRFCHFHRSMKEWGCDEVMPPAELDEDEDEDEDEDDEDDVEDGHEEDDEENDQEGDEDDDEEDDEDDDDEFDEEHTNYDEEVARRHGDIVWSGRGITVLSHPGAWGYSLHDCQPCVDGLCDDDRPDDERHQEVEEGTFECVNSVAGKMLCQYDSAISDWVCRGNTKSAEEQREEAIQRLVEAVENIEEIEQHMPATPNAGAAETAVAVDHAE